MSRFDSDYDDWDDRFNGNGGAMWEQRAHLALRGRRGRKALAELRTALMALPEHRLIEGAMSTVGLREHALAMPEKVPPYFSATVGGPTEPVLNYERQELLDAVEKHGEGVCAVGAYAWYQKVKAGMDPTAAFESLPTNSDTDGSYSAQETAEFGKSVGLTYTLAWELGSMNDETYRWLTPEQRFVAFIGWIDKQLALPPLKAAPRRQKRVRRVLPALPPDTLTLGL